MDIIIQIMKTFLAIFYVCSFLYKCAGLRTSQEDFKESSGYYCSRAPNVTATRNSTDDPHCQTIEKWEKYVPYEISDDLTPFVKSQIHRAINDWNSYFNNCIIFSKRQLEPNFVIFHSSPGRCYSVVGKHVGSQTIGLDPLLCSSHGRIFHEMMHTIGFVHEHNRPDRDEYIKVKFDNIPERWRKQYLKVKDFYFGELGPYDYYSIMHYRALGPDFEIPAFDILKSGVDGSRVGKQLDLSELDKIKVRKLYCPE